MSCRGGNGSGGGITKKKVVIFTLVGAGIAAASYYLLTTTNVTTAVALVPLAGFAACPAMCAAMGGGIWIKNRLSKNKNKKSNLKEDLNLKGKAREEDDDNILPLHRKMNLEKENHTFE